MPQDNIQSISLNQKSLISVKVKWSKRTGQADTYINKYK